MKMKPESKNLIESHILRDFINYERMKPPWTEQLYNLSKKNVNLVPKQVESLVKILSQMSQDETEVIRRKAVFALANFSKKSGEFVTKCAEMGVFEILLYTFLDFDHLAQMAIFSLVGSFCRQTKSEEVMYVVSKLRLLDFMLACLASTQDHLITAVSRAMLDVVVHIELLLDLSAKGLFKILALIIMDDFPGVKERTLSAIALVRRASEHPQPIPHTIARSGCLGLVAHFVNHPENAYTKLALGTIMNLGLINLDYIIPLLAPYLFCDVISFLMFDDVEIKFYAANIVRRITETSRSLTGMLVENGLLEALLYALQTVRYSADPSLIVLANILRSSLEATNHFIELKGHLILCILLHENCCEYVVFSIAQIFTDIFERGKPLNNLIANLDIYPRLVELYRKPSSSRYMRSAMSDCCKRFLKDCCDWELIKNFFIIAPTKMLAYVARHFSEVLPDNLYERKIFLEMENPLRIMQLRVSPGDPVERYVEIIKACYPQDIINFYSPEFQRSILQRMDKLYGINCKIAKRTSKKKWDWVANDIEEEEDI